MLLTVPAGSAGRSPQRQEMGWWRPTSGMVYGRVCEEERVSYTAFYERMQKLEYLRLVDMEVWHGQGRSRVVMPRDGVEEVVGGKGVGKSR